MKRQKIQNSSNFGNPVNGYKSNIIIKPSPDSSAVADGNDIGGFTLAEMLIVIAITVILLGIGSRVYYQEKDKFVYNDALTKVMEIIKTARNSAITNRLVPDSNNKNIVPINGYGIYINLEPTALEPHFTLFASLGYDDINEKTYNKKFDGGTDKNGNDYIIETYRLPKQMQFQYFVFDKVEQFDKTTSKSAIAKEAVIIFRPPLAETYLGDNATKELEELSMRFYNNLAPTDSSKRCQYIRISRIKTFPYIEYSNCSEYPIDTNG